MSSQAKKLGTFGGVFTPSLLTILGVIMYLRFGWVVGNVGLFGTLIIVTLSTSITFLTALSIASIATNAPIKAGGAYFMVSRSLGVEIGGAIGIPLYLAQAFSVALYVIGFSESVVAVFPAMDIKLVGIATTLLLGALALFSTNATIKAQYVILVVIGASLLSLVFGSPLEESKIELWGVAPEKSADFWKVFAIFFPAVTGIMAGVNMSGDLKNPSKSIPKGTFLAVGVGYVIYMILPLILASRADASTLVADPLIMRRISFWGDAILLGIWGATLSSAVGSLLGAPRVLQALAIDKVLPKSLGFFRRGVGKEKIPRAGTVFTMAITLACVWLGNLDVIAPVLSMFFLTTYGVLNITAGVERFLRIPSYRPKFKVHWSLSFLGAIGCMAVMFLINPLATIAAIILIFLVFLWLKRRGLKTAWGDVRSGVFTTVVRYSILQLKKPANPKSWRPHILVLSGAPTKRWHLIDFANALTQQKALFTVATILPEEGVSQERTIAYEKQVTEYLYNKQINALVRIIRAPDPFSGGAQLVNAYGLGALVPNTVLLGDTREQGHHQPYGEMIRHIYHSQRNILIVQDDDNLGFNNKQHIDIWWGGLRGNGGLMMVLAYLLQSSPQWRHAKVTIKMVVGSAEAATNTEENLTEMITQMRMNFRKKIIVQGDESFWTIMKQESKGADLVMLGLAPPEIGFAEYYGKLKDNTDTIPTKVYVLAAQDIEFKDVLT
ncbi:MAG: Na-K-Cl cotransporter [Cyclobacteriaceae bacterium]